MNPPTPFGRVPGGRPQVHRFARAGFGLAAALAALGVAASAGAHDESGASGTVVSGWATLPNSSDAAVERAARDMGHAALNFWAALTPEERAKAGIAFGDSNRFDWHYIPRKRKGLTWNDMTPEQQQLAHAFLASGLSSRGYMQVETIMSLDQVLKEIEQGHGPLRDPNNYAFTVFGTPGPDSTWGWRFEGHHVSLNFTIVSGRAVAGPVFFGSNPAEVRHGPRKGLRVLAIEEDLGRQLVKSLDPAQRAEAIIQVVAPKDIITRNSRKANPGPPIGVPASEMTPAQQRLLMSLVENYAYRLRAELAESDLARIDAAGFKNIHFAWAGGLEPGEGHYYRIHGPTFLIEFDDTQDHANHIHTVWRDSAHDFGEDLLREHYEESHRDQLPAGN